MTASTLATERRPQRETQTISNIAEAREYGRYDMFFVRRGDSSKHTLNSFEHFSEEHSVPSSGWTNATSISPSGGSSASQTISEPMSNFARVRRIVKELQNLIPPEPDPVHSFREELVRGLSRYKSSEATELVFSRIAADIEFALPSVLTFARLPSVEVNDEGTCSLFWTKEQNGEASRVALSFSGSGNVVVTLVYSNSKRGQAERVTVRDHSALARLLGQHEFLGIIGQH